MRRHRREKLPVGGGPERGEARWAPGAEVPSRVVAVPSAAAADPAVVGAQPRVGGYRLVRVLGEGRSAVVYLGYADTGPDDEPRRTAAVKVYRASAHAARIDAEVAALGAVAHPHVQRLLDVASTGDGVPCLVLERCDTGGLARLVVERSSLSPGEAVTILAPLVAAVGAVHAAGFAHRGIRLSTVLFGQSGEPVLCGFGGAVAIAGAPTPAALAADAAVLDDRVRLLTVVRAVLERLDEPLAVSVDDWLEMHPVAADDFGAVLSDALFDLAEPEPVRLRERAGAPAAAVLRPRPAAPAVETGTRSPAWRRSGELASTLVRHARGVRRRYWTIASGVAASLVVAVIAVPQGEGPPPDLGIAATPSATVSATGPGGDDGGGTQSASPGGTAVLGDDPVAALEALLAERRRCVRDLSVLCLDAVLQQGSAALERDVAVIRALQAGGEQTTDATLDTNGPVLVERLGDSALLDLGDVPQTQPASALVMRGEAGWRIRDYLDE